MIASKKYDIASRILHWISAIIILWATVSGILISYFDVSESAKNFVGNFNVSLTTVFIPIFIFRVLNRLKLGAPTYNEILSGFEKRAALVTHMLLYIITTVVLVSGYLMMDTGINVFEIVELPVLIHEQDTQKMFEYLHTASNHLLALLIFCHVAAVIKHEIKGIHVYRRMAI